MGGLFWFIFLAAYAYMGITLQTIAGKTGTPDGWLAWIPVANVYLMCKIAGKPTWWVVLFFIPFVNLIMGIIVGFIVLSICLPIFEMSTLVR